MRDSELVECARCGKVEFAGNADRWNVVFNMGRVAGFLCPDCQTAEEDIEAQVNEATTDYSKTFTVSSLPELLEIFRPLLVEALQVIADGETERGNALFGECLESFRKGYNALHNDEIGVLLANKKEAYDLLVSIGELPQL